MSHMIDGAEMAGKDESMTAEESWAAEYDKATAEAEWKAPAEVAAAVLPSLKPGERLLDIGSGTGQSLEPFTGQQVEIDGVEASADMIKMAQKKLPGANFFQGKFEEVLPGLESERYNHVTAVGVLEFAKDLDEAFRQVERVLIPGGRFAFTVEELVPENSWQQEPISVYGENSAGADALIVRRYAAEAIDERLRAAGFNVEDNHRFQAYLRDGNPVLFQMFLAKKAG